MKSETYENVLFPLLNDEYVSKRPSLKLMEISLFGRKRLRYINRILSNFYLEAQ